MYWTVLEFLKNFGGFSDRVIFGQSFGNSWGIYGGKYLLYKIYAGMEKLVWLVGWRGSRLS